MRWYDIGLFVIFIGVVVIPGFLEAIVALLGLLFSFAIRMFSKIFDLFGMGK